jgi:hypothetical protein
MLQEYVLSVFKGMLQVLYIFVTKVDLNVVRVVMAIHVCFKCMFQMFHLFQMYVVSVLSECCKSRSGCCIYMHVARICFQVFSGISYICLQVFHLDVVLLCPIKRVAVGSVLVKLSQL